MKKTKTALIDLPEIGELRLAIRMKAGLLMVVIKTTGQGEREQQAEATTRDQHHTRRK